MYLFHICSVYMYICLCLQHILICLSSAHARACVCVCVYLHISMGGRPGAFLPRQIQHIPLQAVKEKDFIVCAANEKPFLAPAGASFPSHISKRTKPPRPRAKSPGTRTQDESDSDIRLDLATHCSIDKQQDNGHGRRARRSSESQRIPVATICVRGRKAERGVGHARGGSMHLVGS